MNTSTRGLLIVKEIKDRIQVNSDYLASEIVSKIWEDYKKNYTEDNSVNGAVFEEIIGYVLTVKGCTPFYMQAKVAYVPNVNYDFILFDLEKGPISISAKTSLRERWKQADLEAVALKYVHRNALSYAITLNHNEVKARLLRIQDCMGLNDFVLADTERFDQLIIELQNRKLDLAGTIDVVKSHTLIDSVNGKARYEIA